MSLPTDTSPIQLDNHLQILKEVLATVSSQTKQYPEGNLRIANQGSYSQFYHITKVGDKGTFIDKSQTDLIQKLAQKGYEHKLEKVINKHICQIKDFLNRYNPSELIDAYSSLHPERKKLITPYFLSDEEYAEQWSRVPYTGKPFTDDMPEHYASNGLRVRSKSEVIIANVLSKLQIPFRYEAAIKIKVKKGGQSQIVKFHPDFTCLNARTRQEFIWEHFGLMNDEGYLENAIEKERIYAAAGYIPGINFISTMESKNIPLNSKHVEQIAKNLLK